MSNAIAAPQSQIQLKGFAWFSYIIFCYEIVGLLFSIPWFHNRKYRQMYEPAADAWPQTAIENPKALGAKHECGMVAEYWPLAAAIQLPISFRAWNDFGTVSWFWPFSALQMMMAFQVNEQSLWNGKVVHSGFNRLFLDCAFSN